ncbi:hypothetical protein HN954_05065 [bacterium]|nr:hypothetical protein [bacterium]MBT6832319.1 hypothetical protein [bacterium]MBT6996764.1 hypothetical protein [bacterium]MBT7772823.1 hypothetical protein [bacterium]
MRTRCKNSGATLLISIVLCGLILTVGLGLSRALMRELDFSSDLILSEKSYFGAESGVELALLKLKKEPTQNLEPTEILSAENFSNTSVSLEIQNLVENFKFTLAPKSSAKFWLRRDIDLGETFEKKPVRDFSFSPKKNWDDSVQWKIQCNSDGNSATALLGKTAGETAISKSTTGENSESIETFLAGFQKPNCSFSLINLSGNSFEISANAPKKMPPHEATIRAIGESGGREKVVEFRYRQKNLSPFFDFGLLQKN